MANDNLGYQDDLDQRRIGRDAETEAARKAADDEERLAWWRQLKEEADVAPKPEYHPGRPPGMERFRIPGYVKPPRKRHATMQEWMDDFWGKPEPKDPDSPDEKRKRLIAQAVTHTDKRRLIDRYFKKLFGYVVPIKHWPVVMKAWRNLDAEFGEKGFLQLLLVIEEIGANERDTKESIAQRVLSLSGDYVHREQLRKETAYRESLPLIGPWLYAQEENDGE